MSQTQRNSRVALAVGPIVFCAALLAGLTAQSQTPAAPVCVHDASVKERFIPVELLTGLPLPETPALAMAPVDRAYRFIDVLPGGKVDGGEVTLKGPVSWSGAGGEYQVYERTVPRSRELFAMTADRTAIGRVYDARIGNVANEGKFPIGTWQQGQTRAYAAVYNNNRQATSTLEIEKLACTWEGIEGAMQYRWKTSAGQDYGYVYAPGQGIVKVYTHRSR